VHVAPFDTTHHSNANIAVIAASGQGKSYAIGALVLEAAARGIGSVIIDPEGEYERIVRALDGDYLRLTPGCSTSLNIFDIGGDANRAETVAAVVELAAVLCGNGLDEVERAVIDAAATQAIATAASQGRGAVLGDCLDALDRGAPRAALVLRRFCNGPLGELFNRPTSAKLDAPVVGVSLRDLGSELIPAATLIVAEWLWSLVRRDHRERHIVFDEVGLLCAHPPLRTLLVQLARRCRKYRASLVVATQNAGDLLATPEGTVVATNPAIVLLGGHRGAETQRMEDAFALTPAQRQSLESAGRGDFLLLAGARRLPIHIEVSPLHHALLTGEPMVRRE
jgi:type IV secretory pathway VirB4 component